MLIGHFLILSEPMSDCAGWIKGGLQKWSSKSSGAIMSSVEVATECAFDIGILLVYGGVNSKLPAVAVYGTEFECITGIGGGS